MITIGVAGSEDSLIDSRGSEFSFVSHDIYIYFINYDAVFLTMFWIAQSNGLNNCNFYEFLLINPTLITLLVNALEFKMIRNTLLQIPNVFHFYCHEGGSCRLIWGSCDHHVDTRVYNSVATFMSLP